MIILESDKWNVSLCQGLENLRQNEIFCDVIVRACNEDAHCNLDNNNSEKDINEQFTSSSTKPKHRTKNTGQQTLCEPAIGQGKFQLDFEKHENDDSTNKSDRIWTNKCEEVDMKVDQICHSNDKFASHCKCSKLKAHSVVLGASSSLLQVAIEQTNIAHYEDKPIKIIHFKEISPLMWEYVLKFVYSGVVCLQENLIPDLKNVAVKLQLTDLLKAIISLSHQTENSYSSERLIRQCRKQKRNSYKAFYSDYSWTVDTSPPCGFNSTRHESKPITEDTTVSTANEIPTSRDFSEESFTEMEDCNNKLNSKIGKAKGLKKATVFKEEVKIADHTLSNLTIIKTAPSTEKLECIETIEDISRTPAADPNVSENENQCNEKAELPSDTHTVLADPQGGQTCPDCGVYQETQEAYNEHQKTHVRRELYICSVCGKKFKNKISMRTHQLVIHASTKCSFTCETCQKTFQRKQDLIVHERSHSGEKPFACGMCPKTFSQKQNMKIHEKTHRNEKNFKCETCGRSFLRKWGLQEHEKTHTGEKPFLCQTCGKSFAKISNLQVHERIHSGIKPYRCPYCPLTFSDPSTLKQHLLVHQDCKVHQCSTCGAQFARAKALKEHERIHTGEKPYKCKECNAAFANTSNLSRHRKSHQKKSKKLKKWKPEECDIKPEVKEEMDLSLNLRDLSFSKLTLGMSGILNISKQSIVNPLTNDKSALSSNDVYSGNQSKISDRSEILQNDIQLIQNSIQPALSNSLDQNVIILSEADLRNNVIYPSHDQFDPVLSNSSHLIHSENLTYSFPDTGICFQIPSGNLL